MTKNYGINKATAKYASNCKQQHRRRQSSSACPTVAWLSNCKLFCDFKFFPILGWTMGSTKNIQGSQDKDTLHRQKTFPKFVSKTWHGSFWMGFWRKIAFNMEEVIYDIRDNGQVGEIGDWRVFNMQCNAYKLSIRPGFYEILCARQTKMLWKDIDGDIAKNYMQYGGWRTWGTHENDTVPWFLVLFLSNIS